MFFLCVQNNSVVHSQAGKTALDKARDNNHRDVAHLLARAPQVGLLMVLPKTVPIFSGCTDSVIFFSSLSFLSKPHEQKDKAIFDHVKLYFDCL